MGATLLTLCALGIGAGATLIAQADAKKPVVEVKPDQNGEYPKPVVQVAIRNFAYKPQKVTIAPGTTVVFTQYDGVGHNVRLFANAKQNKLTQDLVGPMLKKGEQYAVTFTEEGTYDYHCDPHPFMTGTIIVKKDAK